MTKNTNDKVQRKLYIMCVVLQSYNAFILKLCEKMFIVLNIFKNIFPKIVSSNMICEFISALVHQFLHC